MGRSTPDSMGPDGSAVLETALETAPGTAQLVSMMMAPSRRELEVAAARPATTVGTTTPHTPLFVKREASVAAAAAAEAASVVDACKSPPRLPTVLLLPSKRSAPTSELSGPFGPLGPPDAAIRTHCHAARSWRRSRALGALAACSRS